VKKLYTTDLTVAIKRGDFNETFKYLYGARAESAAARYSKAVKEFEKLFGAGEVRLFSAPGRTEVGGNHTDHQHGCVLAAGIDLDIIALARKNNDGIIRVKSEGYHMSQIDLSDLSPQPDECEHFESLVRGVAARFKELGYEIGGFDTYTTNDVLKGSGLSSSAAFEVMLCTLMSKLYNDGKMLPVEAAIVSQYAENKYFNKPCGLMDQTACSCGSFVGIDFKNPEKPLIEKVNFDFAKSGHALCIVDTGGCHADLTGEYADVPAEMKSVAAFFGKEVLRDVDEEEFYQNIAALRKEVSDRAVLRAIHFFDDNRRAVALKEYLQKGDFESFCKTVTESGRSSLCYLQNVFPASAPDQQGLTVALALTEKILAGRGAYRVHGGGFAGTIQAYVPNDLLDTYKSKMEAVFGDKHCYVLNVRPVGGCEIKNGEVVENGRA
jgi:galactokinase